MSKYTKTISKVIIVILVAIITIYTVLVETYGKPIAKTHFSGYEQFRKKTGFITYPLGSDQNNIEQSYFYYHWMGEYVGIHSRKVFKEKYDEVKESYYVMYSDRIKKCKEIDIENGKNEYQYYLCTSDGDLMKAAEVFKTSSEQISVIKSQWKNYSEVLNYNVLCWVLYDGKNSDGSDDSKFFECVLYDDDSKEIMQIVRKLVF